MFRSIKKKLIFLFLVAILTPLLVMRLIAYPSAQKAIKKSIVNNLRLAGSQKTNQVKEWLKGLKNTAERMAHSPVVIEAVYLTGADSVSLSRFISHIPCEAGFVNFMICDMSGKIKVSSERKLVGAQIPFVEGFNQAINGETYISDGASSAFFTAEEARERIPGFPAMYIFVPIRKERSIVGVMAFQVDLSVINRKMQEVQYGDSYDIYIVNDHGVMITESRFIDQVKRLRLIKEKRALELPVTEPETGKFTRGVESCLRGENGFDINGYTNYAGEKVLGAWFWIPEVRWGVITEISFKEVSFAVNNVKNPIHEILSYLTVAGFVLAAAGITFALVIGQKIANPIMKLTVATRKMSAGDLSQRVNIGTHDELHELGDAFNVMVESVQEKTAKLEEAKNFLKNILVSSTEHSVIAGDMDGNILEFNEGAKRMFGYEPEEMIRKANINMLHTLDDVISGRVKKILETTLLTGMYKGEMQFIRKNGEVFTGYSTFTARQSAGGDPIGFVMIMRDITEQKLLEQELQNYTMHLERIIEERTQKLRISEEKYRRLFETSKDVVFFCDTECNFVDINQAGVELFGFESKHEILRLNLIRDLFFSQKEGIAVKEMVCKNGFIKDYEVELRNKEGSIVPCMMTSNLKKDELSNIIGYEGIIIDLTERKRIEQEKDILNNINKILASRLDIREVYKSLCKELNKVVDFDRMSITLLNERRDEFLVFAVSKDYGISKLGEGTHYSKHGTLAGKVVQNREIYIVNDTSEGAFCTDPILRKEGIKSRLSFPLICKGEIFGSLNFGSKKVRNFTENHIEIINKIVPQLAIAIDNTRLFDKIKESEEKYRNLVEDIEDIIFRMDETGRYLFLNSALKNVTGYKPQEFYNNPSLSVQIIHKDDVELVKKTIRQILAGELKVSKDMEYRIYRKNGDELWVSQNTYPVKNQKGDITGIEGIIRDITGSKKIEEQIRRSERLASIGELAASIAHEIRNPLGAISNSVGMLRRDLDLKGDDKRLFEMVVEETDRLNSIVTKFLTFAHPAEYHFVKSDIIEIIDETLFLLEQDARFSERIKIVKIYDKGVPKVYLDRDWIRKVFWNLLVNAIEAIQSSGKIFIRIRKPKSFDGNEIEIVIADTGVGMSPEVVKNIFEPFYTTKKSTGTGLGLSVVHRIVDNHGGLIDVKSKENKGTVFTLRLPVKNKHVKNI